MSRIVVLVAALLLAAPPARADDPPLAAGNWLLSYMPVATPERRMALLKVETKDGKPTATLVSAGQRDSVKVDGFRVEGKIASFTLDVGVKLQFEGVVDAKDPRRVLGSFGDDQRVFFAKLAASELETLGRQDMMASVPLPEPMQQAQKLQISIARLQFKLSKAEEGEEKNELQKKLDEARKEANEKIPGLLKEVVERDPDAQAAFDAALDLLRQADKIKANPKEVAAWAETAAKFAEPYGPRMRRETAARLAEVVLSQQAFVHIALLYAEKAAGDTTAPLAAQARALRSLKEAQERTSNPDAAKATDARLVKVEGQLDAEYLKNVPPFQPTKYGGRKPGANRVAMLELFTGAQCPPCVAADVAGDALLKAYDSKDLILVQYHLHIPGPDPLTNPDTLARMDYYSKAFPDDVGGVPTTLFNGKPQGGGGGGMGASEEKFKEYREIIDPILEKKSDVTVAAKAGRRGDVLELEAVVGGLKDTANDLKLRLLVVEESVHYVGGNGIRFHHHVVRVMPGGAEGVAVKDLKEGKHIARVDLAELRKERTKYLDDFVAKEGPFPNAERPLAFKDLRVVAFVQDDKTHEILQATQVEVEERK
jgi:hypothetical protein